MVESEVAKARDTLWLRLEKLGEPVDETDDAAVAAAQFPGLQIAPLGPER